VASAVLLTAVRPKFASFTRQQWLPVLALALIFATMNLSLYTAIEDRARPVSRPDRASP
jgi:inner membrane transporter RhtA